jgi:hypothetical protein
MQSMHLGQRGALRINHYIHNSHHLDHNTTTPLQTETEEHADYSVEHQEEPSQAEDRGE